jgi:hypothetical protein
LQAILLRSLSGYHLKRAHSTEDQNCDLPIKIINRMPFVDSLIDGKLRYRTSFDVSTVEAFEHRSTLPGCEFEASDAPHGQEKSGHSGLDPLRERVDDQ